jgi:hypothetical protein
MASHTLWCKCQKTFAAATAMGSAKTTLETRKIELLRCIYTSLWQNHLDEDRQKQQAWVVG